MEYLTKVLTGIRPTGSLTVANYIGAVLPVVELQNQGINPLVFVADIHAITDKEPDIVKQHLYDVVADYIALGVDTNKANIYIQSSIIGEVATLTTILARHISVAELLRVPTLKDKLKNNANPETANSLLLLYPVMMAADILLNKAKKVPVGEDQLSHIEVTRLLAKRFNSRYGEVLPIPEVLQVKSLRISSLKGPGKMSKTNPGGAIFLTDDPKTITQKIKTAETAFAGEMNQRLESHIIIAKNLSRNKSDIETIDSIINEHMSGKPVMGKFKDELTRITLNFIKDFQERRSKIDSEYIKSVLEKGASIARNNAVETIKQVMKALYN